MIYKLRIKLRNPISRYDLTKYSAHFRNAVVSHNARSNNTITDINVRKYEVIILMNMENHTDTPLKRLIHFSRSMMSIIGHLSLVKGKLFKAMPTVLYDRDDNIDIADNTMPLLCNEIIKYATDSSNILLSGIQLSDIDTKKVKKIVDIIKGRY